MTRSLRFALGLVLASTAIPAAAQSSPDHAQARQMFERVISFRTSHGQGQVPAMVAYLEQELRNGGIPAAQIAKLPSGETTAMLVRIPGTDAAARPILFSAHMDVVDARPEDWQRDPYKLIEEGGYFYGRGTIDNKAGVVALASTILHLHKAGLKPRRALVFAFVGDEETALDEPTGTTRMIAAHPWVKGAEYAINTDAGGGILAPDGKPIIYLVQGAEKTYASYQLLATNPGGHSSRPRADNAIHDLVEAVTRVARHRFPVSSNALTRAYLGAVGKVTPGAEGQALRAFAANPNDSAAADAIWNDPEFVGTTRTTCVATKLEAGHAENALPQTAKALVNCRIFPGVEVEAIRAELGAAIGNPAVAITTLNKPEASPVSEMRDDVMAAITRAVHAKHPGVPVVPYLESGGTDGKIYRIAGIPTYASSGLFSKPSEMFAHGLNERLPVEAFYAGLEHIYGLAVELGGAKPVR